MSEKKDLSRREKTRELTIMAMFIAIIAIMTFVPYLGFITIGPLSGTIIHIPVIIGAILFGRKFGFVLGTVFGFMSFFRALSSVGLDFAFVFPWVSILPRMIFGLVIWDIYRLSKKLIKNRYAAVTVTFAISSLVHSLLVIPLLFTSFPIILNTPSYFELVQQGATESFDPTTVVEGVNSVVTAFRMLWAFLVANGFTEALFAAIVGPIIVSRLLKYFETHHNPLVKLEG